MENNKKTILLLGGVRSGKSLHGEELASSLSEDVAYLAAAKVTDEEMQKRISKHRQRRPASWKTYELVQENTTENEIIDLLEEIFLRGHKVILIDCITNLVFRLIDGLELDGLETISNEVEQDTLDDIDSFISKFLNKLSESAATVIIVSNEMGLGVVPPYPLGRLFRDIMGSVNKRMADAADEVYFFIAGLKQKVK